MPRVVVVIPTLNEEEAIGGVIDGVREALRGRDFEVLVVDGYSRDRTVEVARAHGAHVIYQRGQGYGDAYITGFEYAVERMGAEILVMIDGDGTYEPRDIPRMLELIEREVADLVVGNRFEGMEPGAMPFLNRIGNRVISLAARLLMGVRVRDTQSGLRAFRREVLDSITLTHSGMPLALEMLIEAAQANLRVAEVPTRYYRRASGKPKLRPLRDGAQIMALLLRMVRDYRPMLFFGLMGFAMIGAGAAVGVSVVVEWLTTGVIRRLASVVLSALLVMTGIQLVSLGLLADMINDVLRRAVRKP